MPEFMNCECCMDTDDYGKPMDKTCPAVGFQKVNVCVPVTVMPFAHAGSTKIKCQGKPVVTPGYTPCPGKKNGICTFTISQTICVEVPVDFGASTAIGDTFVDCLSASAHDICKCSKTEEAVEIDE